MNRARTTIRLQRLPIRSGAPILSGLSGLCWRSPPAQQPASAAGWLLTQFVIPRTLADWLVMILGYPIIINTIMYWLTSWPTWLWIGGLT